MAYLAGNLAPAFSDAVVDTPIPLLDLVPQYRQFRDEALEVIRHTCDNQQFILGEKVTQFEIDAGKYCGDVHAIGVSSGTDALLMGLMALGVGPGDEVITSPFTFFATAGSIARVGARPVFVDIQADSFNIAPRLVKKAITARTKVIMPVHLFGQTADMSELAQVADGKIKIFEDAAQAIGAEYKGQRAGALGDLAAFSFFPSKNLGAFGDAGMVTTKDAALAQRLKTFRVHGEETRYFHKFVGGNFRIDALQAAVLQVKLKYLDSWSQGRRKNAELYARLFEKAGLSSTQSIAQANDNRETPVVLPRVQPHNHHVFNQYVVRVRSRDKLADFLKSRGIGSAVYYPRPLHLQECFVSLGYKEGDFPESERAAHEVLALPIFAELTQNQLERVVNCIGDFYSS